VALFFKINDFLGEKKSFFSQKYSFLWTSYQIAFQKLKSPCILCCFRWWNSNNLFSILSISFKVFNKNLTKPNAKSMV